MKKQIKCFKIEREAIISLRKNKDIVIFEADKGGTVVVMNKNDYISEAKKHLNSVDADGNIIYEELSFVCTQKFVCDVSKAIEKAAANKVIDGELAELFNSKFPETRKHTFFAQNTQRYKTISREASLQQSVHLP